MNAEFPGPSLVYAVSQVRLPGQAGRTKQAQRTYQAPVALCILDFMLYSPSCPGRGCSHSCDTDDPLLLEHPSHCRLPLPRHLLTHIQAPARVTRPTASQPGESRCLFSASPRENSLPAVACPILSLPPPPLPPPPHFLPACSWIFPLQERPQDSGQGPQVQLPRPGHMLPPSTSPLCPPRGPEI